MGIISWIIFGAVAGWLATTLTGKKENKGCLFNVVIGIVGAFIGGAMFEYLGEPGEDVLVVFRDFLVPRHTHRAVLVVGIHEFESVVPVFLL